MAFDHETNEPRHDQVESNGMNGEALQPEVSPDASDQTHWHSEAGRKGAHRVHQLIRLGRIYEQEHGLKRGRQRLRQLMELGKLYEQEHGTAPAAERKGRTRLSRMERDQIMETLLECMIRISKPSFRADFERMLDKESDQNHAA